MVVINRRRFFGRATRVSAATVALLALPVVADAVPSPAIQFDASVGRLRLAYLAQTPGVQEALLGVINSFANFTAR